MKVDEISIGDWVKSREHECARVTGLHKGGFITLDKGDLLDTFREDQINPIPLTEDILKLNGFVRSEMSLKMCWCVQDGIFYDCVRTDGTYDYVIKVTTCGVFNHASDINIKTPVIELDMPLSFVHQLQRIYRCCQLWGFADKFKVL